MTMVALIDVQIRTAIVLIGLSLGFGSPSTAQSSLGEFGANKNQAVRQDGSGVVLKYPKPESKSSTSNRPGPGRLVRVTAPEYEGTDVHHMLYLSPEWSRENVQRSTLPVIVEYTGNHFPAAGCTGKVEGARLGYGIGSGLKGGFIWVVLPFVSADGQSNQSRWWGDEKATVEYAKLNVPRLCQDFGGDPKRVLLCGFSRGAIATNYIGLYDDEIARLWCGFLSHDHYDGVRQWSRPWGAPLAHYRKQAAVRLSRLGDRPVLVSHAGKGIEETREYLGSLKQLIHFDNFKFVSPDLSTIFKKFPNEHAVHPHNDVWLIKDSPARQTVWKWVSELMVKP